MSLRTKEDAHHFLATAAMVVAGFVMYSVGYLNGRELVAFIVTAWIASLLLNYVRLHWRFKANDE